LHPATHPLAESLTIAPSAVIRCVACREWRWGVVVVSGTRHNHMVLREVRPLLADDLPLGTRAVMSALSAGRDPGANGLVVL